MGRLAYVTVLTTSDYLEGVQVLNYSLRQAGAKYPLVVLCGEDLPRSVNDTLTASGIEVHPVASIPNPVPSKARQPHWAHWNTTYTKLRIFGLDFEKVIYVDADMLVCTNLDLLFSKPHLSAVNAGGQLPWLRDWIDLNSGLMVVEPSAPLLGEMLQKVGQLPVKDHGDQSFLHCYYPDWPKREDLHLDHKYNLFSVHLDDYSKLFGYRVIRRFPANDLELNDPMTVSVIHYIGLKKPWHADYPMRPWYRRLLQRGTAKPLLGHAATLWFQAREKMISECNGRLLT